MNSYIVSNLLFWTYRYTNWTVGNDILLV